MVFSLFSAYFILILSKYDIPYNEVANEYLYIFQAYSNLGYFKEAEAALDIIENNYPNSGLSVGRYRDMIVD